MDPLLPLLDFVPPVWSAYRSHAVCVVEICTYTMEFIQENLWAGGVSALRAIPVAHAFSTPTDVSPPRPSPNGDLTAVRVKIQKLEEML